MSGRLGGGGAPRSSRACRSDPSSLLGQQVQGQIGAVRDDRVRPLMQQGPHVLRLVDGPDVHLDADRVGALDQPLGDQAAIAQALKKNVWPLVEGKKIQPVIFKTFAAADAAQAHALMESNQHVGKIVLTW